jgi:cardiolipin synthase
MEGMYEEDLTNATEIVLDARRRVCSTGAPVRRRRARAGGSTARAAAGALRLGNTVGAAIADRRVLGPAEAGIMTGAGLALLGFALIGILWPLAIVLPLALAAGWAAVSLLVRARELRAAGRRQS